MPPWVAKEKIETLLLASEMPVSIPPSRTVVRGAPRKSLGILRRVTNEGESGFGTASDRVKANDHRPSGTRGEVWWGALSKEGRKLDCFSKVNIGFPVSSQGALIKR